MKAVIALVLIMLGVAGGGALGLFLKPAPEAAVTEAKPETPPEPDDDAPPEFVSLGRRLVIPVVEGRETRALMLFEVAIDVAADDSDEVYAKLPRIQDAFLRELMLMSYTGAFMETYTDTRVLNELRRKLAAAAQAQVSVAVRDVLILDAVRQER
ncbi:MAG: hypothetical protein AAGI34_01695 [Pseudomonadota bacterium]